MLQTTDRRQTTDGRTTTYCEREREFAKNYSILLSYGAKHISIC